MSLAIFDLDNTLINGDSDFLWGQFLAENNIVDKVAYENQNEIFYQQYKQGNLDIGEFLKFALKPLADNNPIDLYAWRERFLKEKIRPILLPMAFDLIENHRQRADTLLVITATNQFVTEQIVNELGISNLLATLPEFVNDRFTGNYVGKPCFQDGKVQRLESWLAENNEDMQGSWFYSDSHNDLPLLERVDHPVAVDPDDKLRDYATLAGWPVISLRE